MTGHRGGRTAAALLTLVLALGGCGVPSEDSPRPIDPPVATGSPTPFVTSAAGDGTERLYLVHDDQLVAVDRRAAAGTTVQELLTDLVAGPTDAERSTGVTSALTGTDLIDAVHLEQGTALVTLRPLPDIGRRTDVVLAIGQIVCTLDARSDVDAVRFVRDGTMLQVPRADGSLTDLPVTTGDYRPLITER